MRRDVQAPAGPIPNMAMQEAAQTGRLSTVDSQELVEYGECLVGGLDGAVTVNTYGWITLHTNSEMEDVNVVMDSCNMNLTNGYAAAGYVQITNAPVGYSEVQGDASANVVDLKVNVSQVYPYFMTTNTTSTANDQGANAVKRGYPNLYIDQLAYNYQSLEACNLWTDTCISRSCPYHFAEFVVHVSGINYASVWLHHFCRTNSPKGGNYFATLGVYHKNHAYYVGTGYWKVRSGAATHNSIRRNNGNYNPWRWDQYWCGPHY